MKITSIELRDIVRDELYSNSILSEGVYDLGDNVNVEGVAADGVVRAKNGQHLLVHWAGATASKIPKKRHLKKSSELAYIKKGDVQKGWTWETVDTILDRYPAKGVFTIETPSTIESQALTGRTSSGGHAGTAQADELSTVVDTLASGVAFVADFFPGPGTAISSSIAVGQFLSAISKAAWLGAGLSVITLIPVMGDVWKAAFPWMKWLARLQKAKKITLSAGAIEMLADMVGNWDKYKNSFKETAQQALYASKKGKEAKAKVTGNVLDKVYAAIDEAVDEIREILPNKTVKTESIRSSKVNMTRAQFRRITRKQLRSVIKETYEDVNRERELDHFAESLASDLNRRWGEDAAFKILVYAADIIRPGSYEPSEEEREEFMTEPFTGARKIPQGSLRWK